MSKSGGASRTATATSKSGGAKQRAPGELSKAAQARIARHEYLRSAALANAALARAAGDIHLANRFEHAAQPHTAAIESERAKATARSGGRTEEQTYAIKAARSNAEYYRNLAAKETTYPENKAIYAGKAQAFEQAAVHFEHGNFNPPPATSARANETPESRLSRLEKEDWARTAWNDVAYRALPTGSARFERLATDYRARRSELASELAKAHAEVKARAEKLEYTRLARTKPFESQKYHGPAPLMQHGVTTTINLKQPANASPREMREYEKLSRNVARIQSTINQPRTPQQQREDTARNTLRVRTLAGRLHDAEIDHQHSVYAVRATDPGSKAYDTARTRAKTLYARSESLRAQMNQAVQEEVARLTPARSSTATTRAPRAKKLSA